MRELLIFVIVLAAIVSAAWWMPRAWYRALLYPGRRPNAVSRFLNSANAWFSGRGYGPAFLVTLETKGRRSGHPVRNPMVVAEVGGARYLVSMLGPKADWVLNARAAGGEAALCHGTTEHIRLEEVPSAERAPILKAYLRRAPGGRPHFDIGPDEPLEEFEKIAPLYPVFRIYPR
jgi:deazaflavin-dependent oxidoreductase (nitroreductase family)